MAERLIRVAAERALRKGEVLAPPDHRAWEEFCARFPYAETDDQLAAIADVLEDMESGKPMDRLVCGDVGFGKTEVALRAAYVAAISGTQVAVVAPTTLLARQHFKSFSDRFRGLPIRVRQLSRFVSAKDAADTRAGLADGTVEIVVGTHAVLAKQVKFKDLGLLVIDEEQHFGVAHKERLKELRSDVHVLTLTATPIPRTLQLALSGVRELSLIATPPIDRLAIRTYVSEFDPVTVREAILREHYRGGQCFYVVPRIADLPDVEAFLRDHVPEVKFVVAHGQMAAGDLDEKMNAFYDGRFDVLLSTTIVESGLDIPAANTLIVERADMFGLAQLYQIRGRVGRSRVRAYAFLTTEPRKKLTPQAEKRLRVLGALDSLGAGFTLASQDLDIRGAGNLLGEEQSGQVREVGFELYQEMLQEAIAKLQSGDLTLADEGEWSPQINLGVPVLIPEAYVPDLDVRLGLYRRLSSLERKVEMEGFAAELIDRFGPLPPEVDTLMLVVRIKALCKRAGIAKLDGGPKGATVQFHADKYANPVGLVQFLNDQRGAGQGQGQPHPRPPRLARRQGPPRRRLRHRPRPRRPRQTQGRLTAATRHLRSTEILGGELAAGGEGVRGPPPRDLFLEAGCRDRDRARSAVDRKRRQPPLAPNRPQLVGRHQPVRCVERPEMHLDLVPAAREDRRAAARTEAPPRIVTRLAFDRHRRRGNIAEAPNSAP